MTWLRDRWMPAAVLVAATGLLIGSIAWAAVTDADGERDHAPMMGPGDMMGSRTVPGDGPVRDLDGAARAAAQFADGWDLTVGEVMQFDNGFYAELVEPTGDLATEVLVDPRTGRVHLEWGPAMMWNTTYGMHHARDRGGQKIQPGEASDIAREWLLRNRPAESVDEAEAFPGYYTLHTLRGERIAGMLSVNATTGAVWYHSWHGRFIALVEHPEAETKPAV